MASNGSSGGNALSPGGNGNGGGGNALAPSGPSIAGASSPSPALNINRGQQGSPQRGQGPFSDVHDNLRQVNAQYKQGQRMQKALDDVRVEMDDLMDLGDIVAPEDVIAAAGRLVGKGLEADQMATLLSSMPTMGGQGLAAWVRMHDVTVRNAEAQYGQQLERTRYQLAQAGFRSMAAAHAEQKISDHVKGRMAGMGPLAPQGAAAPAPSGGAGIQPTSVIQMEQPQGGGGNGSQ